MKSNINYLHMAACLAVSIGLFSGTSSADSGVIKDTSGAVVGTSVRPGTNESISVGATHGGSINSVGISADGTIRDNNGSVVGTSVSNSNYRNNRPIGSNGIGSDGNIRDTSGSVVGTQVNERRLENHYWTSGGMNADGAITDTDGNVVGVGKMGIEVDNTLQENGTLISTNMAY